MSLIDEVAAAAAEKTQKNLEKDVCMPSVSLSTTTHSPTPSLDCSFAYLIESLAHAHALSNRLLSTSGWRRQLKRRRRRSKHAFSAR